MKSSVAEQPP
jgi:hypothetical protein